MGNNMNMIMIDRLLKLHVDALNFLDHVLMAKMTNLDFVHSNIYHEPTPKKVGVPLSSSTH